MTPMVARTSLASALFALLALGCTESEQTPETDLTGVGRIVYAVRQHTTFDGSGAPRIDVAGGMGQVMDYGRYVPGARLEILDLASGEVQNVIADYPTADVSSVDVSFDAKKVLFTMKRDPSDNYHIYWAPLEPTLRQRVGDPHDPEGRAMLLERSPLHHVHRIVRPLLIAQGANDPRVVQAESDQMVAALRGRGVEVQYALFPDEGHGFARPENRLAFYALAEQFLAEHLGGRAQPLAGELERSSIQLTR